MTKDIATIRPEAAVVSDTAKAYARTTTRIQVAAAVWSLWGRLRRERGVDQQWLAERLGKDKGRVSRLLKGPGNWTLDTVSDLLEAMGGRLTLVDAHSHEEIARGDVSRLGASRRTRVYVRTTEMWLESEVADPGRLALDRIVPAADTLIPTFNQTVVERSWTGE